MIDWTLPAVDLALRCRALTPWPGTYTFFEGERLIIHKASVFENPDDRPVPEEPGRVFTIGSEVCVITGEGLLRIESLQAACRKKQNIRDFINGNRSLINSKLGN
ncbi:MAG: hypothetical protein JEY99_21470 [Spirochaetales bacterium]|nr:hypothetical protein [Spirochaetales bacterium]